MTMTELQTLIVNNLGEEKWNDLVQMADADTWNTLLNFHKLTPEQKENVYKYSPYVPFIPPEVKA